jgi:hypothetical protein
MAAASAWCGTQTAASAELADVVTAYNAASAGDTVYIPADTATWSDTLLIAKSIYLFGASKSKTRILTSHATDGPAMLVRVSLATDVPVPPCMPLTSCTKATAIICTYSKTGYRFPQFCVIPSFRS